MMDSRFPETMTVEVTAEDIQNGQRREAYRCPIALSVARQIGPTVYGVSFAFNHAIVGGLVYTVPENIQKFAEQFDMGGPVQPLTFTMVRR